MQCSYRNSQKAIPFWWDKRKSTFFKSLHTPALIKNLSFLADMSVTVSWRILGTCLGRESNNNPLVVRNLPAWIIEEEFACTVSLLSLTTSQQDLILRCIREFHWPFQKSHMLTQRIVFTSPVAHWCDYYAHSLPMHSGWSCLPWLVIGAMCRQGIAPVLAASVSRYVSLPATHKWHVRTEGLIINRGSVKPPCLTVLLHMPVSWRKYSFYATNYCHWYGSALGCSLTSPPCHQVGAYTASHETVWATLAVHSSLGLHSLCRAKVQAPFSKSYRFVSSSKCRLVDALCARHEGTNQEEAEWVECAVCVRKCHVQHTLLCLLARAVLCALFQAPEILRQAHLPRLLPFQCTHCTEKERQAHNVMQFEARYNVQLDFTCPSLKYLSWPGAMRAVHMHYKTWGKGEILPEGVWMAEVQLYDKLLPEVHE